MPQDTILLRRIVDRANSLKGLCAPASKPHPNLAVAQTVSLPPPPSIRPKLTVLGLDTRLIDNFARKYDRACKELHSTAQRSLQRACRDFADIPEHSAPTPVSELSARVVIAYTAEYKRSLQTLEKRAMDIATKIAERKGTLKDEKAKAAKKRLPFNSDFVPTLEQQFDLNPYPTVADRAALARQSGMSDRQIEIWFQNRRRRCKEAGLPVRRVSTSSISSTDTEVVPLHLTPPPVQQSPVIDIELASTFDNCDYADSNEYEDDVDEQEDDGPEIIDLTTTPDPEPISSPVNILVPPNPLELPNSQSAPAPYKPRYSLCPPFADSSADGVTSSLVLPVGPFSFPSPTPYWPRQPSSCISPAQTTTPMPPPAFASTMDSLSTVFARLHVTPLSSSRSPSSTSSRTLSSSSSPSSPKPCTPTSSPRTVSTSTMSTASVTGASTSNATPRPYRPRPRVRPPVTIPVSGPVPTPTTASTNEKPKKKKVSGPPRRVPANQRTSSPPSGLANVNPMNLHIDAGNRDQEQGAPSPARTLSSSSSSSSTSTFSFSSRTTSSSSSSSASSTSILPSNFRFAPMSSPTPVPSAPITQPSSSFFSSSFSSFSFSSPSGSVGPTTNPSDSQSHFSFPFSFAL